MKKIILLAILTLIAVSTFSTLTLKRNRTITQSSFTVEKGAVYSLVIDDLSKSLGLSSLQSSIFDGYARYRGLDTNLIAGTYTLSESLDATEAVDLLFAGPNTGETFRITIPEGLNRALIDDLTNELTGESYSKITAQTDQFLAEYEFLGSIPAGQNLEGYLFPDTYELFTGASTTALVNRQLSTFNTKVYQQYAEELTSHPKYSLHELLTLASVVEREVRQPETRKMVADIFLKRLDIGMPLQSDATINFITNKGMPSPLFKDLEVESPYNTYRNGGLPPGPIANPSISSIEAVLSPTANDYYYFLTTDAGVIHYAKNFDQHVANKFKYLK
jgi:UPF0755 protein